MGHRELIPRTGVSALRGMVGFSPGLVAGQGWTQSPEVWTESRTQSPQDGVTARI